MATPEEIEIYKQRYETYRHLDKLRWQILQMAVGAGTLTLAFAREGPKPAWWVLIAVGTMLCLFAVTILRIRFGVDRNNEVLKSVASVVGDDDIPPVSKWRNSISFWIPVFLIACGLTCFVSSWFVCN